LFSAYFDFLYTNEYVFAKWTVVFNIILLDACSYLSKRKCAILSKRREKQHASI